MQDSLHFDDNQRAERVSQRIAVRQFTLKGLFAVVLIAASVLGVQRVYELTVGETSVLAAVVAYVGFIYVARRDFFRPQWALGIFMLVICGFACILRFARRAGPLDNLWLAVLTLTIALSGVVGVLALSSSIIRAATRTLHHKQS